MRRDAFENFISAQIAAIQSTLNNKNKEYARSNDDALANFKRRAATLGLDPLTILSVDVLKHQDAIVSFIQRYRTGTAEILNEPIQQRARDVAIYMLLFMALIEDLAIAQQVHSE